MSDAVLFVGTYGIPEGGADAFYSQVIAMNEVVRELEPRVVFIGHYVNEDETEGTSARLHPDAGSFDFHMATATRAISTGTQAVRVKRGSSSMGSHQMPSLNNSQQLLMFK